MSAENKLDVRHYIKSFCVRVHFYVRLNLFFIELSETEI